MLRVCNWQDAPFSGPFEDFGRSVYASESVRSFAEPAWEIKAGKMHRLPIPETTTITLSKSAMLER